MNEKASVIAIDIGGGSTKLALVDRQGEIRNWQSFPTVAADGRAFIEKVIAACEALRALAEASAVGVAVAVAGFVTPDGALEYNPNLPWLEGMSIGALLATRLSLSAYVDADSNAACVAEYIFGEGRGTSRFLCLTGGTGLGVGMMIEGRLLRIAHGCLGDAGHVIVAPNGPLCTCGGRGCAEATVSTVALADRYAQMSGHERGRFRLLVEDAQRGECVAQRLLEEAGQWLGIAAASLASIFFPDRIAIAGGLSQAGDAFFRTAEEAFRSHCGSLPLLSASLVRASTGEHATLLGAAAEFFYPELR